MADNNTATTNQDIIVHHDPVISKKKLVRRKNLSSDDCKRLISSLLDHCHDNEYILKRGALSKIARDFNISPQCVSEKWNIARANYNNPDVRAFQAIPNRKGKSGRKQKYHPDDVVLALEGIETDKRKSIKQAAAALDIPYTCLYNMTKADKYIETLCLDVKTQRMNIIHELDTEAYELNREAIELNRKAIEINKKLNDIALKKKYTEFCFKLIQRYLEKGQVRWSFTSIRFDQYGGFYTHTNAEEYESSNNSPHPIYLENKLLQKCAQSFQISYITAYACFNDKGGIKRYDVKIGMKDKTTTTIEAEKQIIGE